MSRRWKVLITVSVAVFMASLDLFIVNVALPGIGRAFPASGLASTSWVSPRSARTCPWTTP